MLMTLTGIGVLMSYFPVDHFRSVGWINTALSVSTLISFMFLFRGERSCKVKDRQMNCSFKRTCHSNMAMSKLSVLIISFYTYSNSEYSEISFIWTPFKKTCWLLFRGGLCRSSVYLGDHLRCLSFIISWLFFRGGH